MGRTKGTSIAEVVKFLRARRDEAQQALPPALHAYLDDGVTDDAWYPEEDLVDLVRGMVEILDAPAEDILAFLGAEAMQRQRSGPCAALFRRFPDERVLRVAATAWKASHDTGKLRLVRDAVGRGSCELVDFSHPSGEMCGIVEGYATALLELLGFREVRASKNSCVLQGDDGCTWSFAWTEPA